MITPCHCGKLSLFPKHLYSHSLLWPSQQPWEVSRRQYYSHLDTWRDLFKLLGLPGNLGSVFICSCQLIFALRAAWGGTKREALWGCCTSGGLRCPFPLYNVHHHLQMLHATRLPFPHHPSRSTLKREYDTRPHSQHPLYPCPASFCHHTYYFRMYYIHTCSHSVFVVQLPHWNARSLRVRIFVCFVWISPATGILLAKDPIKCQHESLGLRVQTISHGSTRGVLSFLGARVTIVL